MAIEKSAAALSEELGERLKQARLNLNLTQSEVAALAGVARKTESAIRSVCGNYDCTEFNGSIEFISAKTRNITIAAG